VQDAAGFGWDLGAKPTFNWKKLIAEKVPLVPFCTCVPFVPLYLCISDAYFFWFSLNFTPISDALVLLLFLTILDAGD